ncbi:hypothetical protein [Haladaptatus caseinilyticus]|uniref:hypothetical protein n=1 Tax=Haladaptatus caseinilyticus TaxID=2993314 RepID=UPI00224B41EE|nr:hypothetical protein [Haladaptatus caseinilyticus]
MSQSNLNFEIDCCKASLPQNRQHGHPQWRSNTPDRTTTAGDDDTTPIKSSDYSYRYPDRLQETYDRIGTIAGTASHFGISESTARTWLIHHGIYDPETDGIPAPAERLKELHPEDLGLTPLGERR